MNDIKFIFFDLDRTLWDFEKNSIVTFSDIFEKYNLSEIFPNFDTFVTKYKYHNEKLWAKYRLGEIKKEELRNKRFLLTLAEFGVNDENLAKKMGDDYISISPTKTQLFPHTIDVLEYLYNKYTLAIITNGFKEIQYTKLKNCGLEKYFKKIICSEDVGHQKPHHDIFHFALSSLNAKKNESIMIGDDYKIDILGAYNFGFKSIFFNIHKNKVENLSNMQEISSLEQLLDIL